MVLWRSLTYSPVLHCTLRLHLIVSLADYREGRGCAGISDWYQISGASWGGWVWFSNLVRVCRQPILWRDTSGKPYPRLVVLRSNDQSACVRTILEREFIHNLKAVCKAGFFLQTKTYHMVDANEPVLERAVGTKITWKPGKNITVKVTFDTLSHFIFSSLYSNRNTHAPTLHAMKEEFRSHKHQCILHLTSHFCLPCIESIISTQIPILMDPLTDIAL